MSKNQTDAPFKRVAATNRKARFQYHIIETLQAGIVLQGTEVKSIRQGKVNLQDGYAAIKNGELFLIDCHITPYSHGNVSNHEPLRPRKLLVHKREISRLYAKIQTKGVTLVPLKMYFDRGHVKVDIGLGKGKTLYDKKDAIKKRDLEREVRNEGY